MILFSSELFNYFIRLSFVITAHCKDFSDCHSQRHNLVQSLILSTFRANNILFRITIEYLWFFLCQSIFIDRSKNLSCTTYSDILRSFFVCKRLLNVFELNDLEKGGTHVNKKTTIINRLTLTLKDCLNTMCFEISGVLIYANNVTHFLFLFILKKHRLSFHIESLTRVLQ